MKKNSAIIVLAIMMFLTSCNNEVGRMLLSTVGEAAVAAGGLILYEYGVNVDGMSEVDAQTAVSELTNTIGFNNNSINTAIAWKNGELNYADKTNIIKNKALDLLGTATDTREIMDVLKQGMENQLNYASAVFDYKSGKNTINLDSLYNEKIRIDFNLAYETYQNAKTKKAQYIKDQLQIEKKLIESGNDPTYAKEIAGYILSVNKSQDYTEQEKRNILMCFGLIEDERDYEMISYISNENDDNISLELIYETDSKDSIVCVENENVVISDNEILNIINSTIISSYDINVTELDQVQKTKLDNIVSLLEKINLNIEIIGHTCNLGGEKVNYKVGLKRANAAKDYLISYGISEERIIVSSQGECNPIRPNDSDENRMANRRITFEIK